MLENIKSGEKRFETCKYNLMGSKCSLDGYPILDCEKCTTYKELPTKRYCLVLCQDEPDERIVFAELTDMYADAVRKDIKGMLNKPTTLMTVDGEEVDIGIVDDIFESTELDTFPDDDDDYSKVFEVPTAWLLKTISSMDSYNERKGVTVQEFLEEYVWEETEVIYNLAKEQDKILKETVQK